MTNEHIKTIEINGIKMEVDLRTAKRIDEFKVGDNVKVLQKNHSSYSVYPGVIVDFVNFKELPTIQIAIFKNEYFGTTLDFINFNSQTEDIEISPVSNHELKLEKTRVIDKLDMEIEETQRKVDSLKNKKDYLIKHFAKYFEQ